MRLFSWNIQSGKGCDNITNIDRIVEHIKSSGDFDLICLQEVVRNMEEYCAQEQMDQLKVFTRAFFDFHFVWGTGFSWPTAGQNVDGNQEFGNLTLVKTQALDHRVHQLPMPAAKGKKQMPRVAVETVLESDIGPLSVINTHLAYHDSHERQRQLERLTLLDNERKNQLAHPKKADSGAYRAGPLAVARILCGDFNFGTEFSEYDYLIENAWLDAWRVCNKDKPHSPTCGIFDSKQWPQGPHCRDFFWLSSELASTRMRMEVDEDTALSDHQPIKLEISI